MPQRFHSEGMTLIEVTIVVAIVGIMVAVGVPAFDNWMKTERVKSGARDLALGLQRAKSLAVRRGHNVIIAFNSPANDNYQIVDDPNNNCVAEGGEVVLYSASLPPGVDMPAASITFSNSNAAFDSRGLPLGDAAGVCIPFGTGGGAGAGTITVQMTGHNAQYQVSMSLAGGVSVVRQ
jgi:prepilin-type N-terminal cleavage/methylation domain-containing protein